MYHMKNNPPSAEKKSPTNHPIISLKNKNKQKNRFNVKIEFQELKLQKTKSKNLTNIIKEDQQIRKVETLEEELTFHEDFFLKIFKFFDWSHCERKFLYMKDVYLYDGIECQITDLFEKFFQNVVKYLESNYYHSFLESNFYKKKLLFFQRDKLEERLSFTKPSFFSKEKQKGSNRILSFDLENQLTSSMMFKKKRAVAALQLQDIRNMKYAKENPYSIFQESERSSILPYFPQNKKNFFFEKEEAILEETQIADN